MGVEILKTLTAKKRGDYNNNRAAYTSLGCIYAPADYVRL